MAHFARINENSIVVEVLVVPDDQEYRGHDYLSGDLGLGGRWLKTSYNTYGGVHLLGGVPFRKNYAGIGDTYDEERDAFYQPRPYPSWTLDEESCVWVAPISKPDETQMYDWDESSLSWVYVPPPVPPVHDASHL